MSNNVTYKQLEGYFEILRPSKKIFDFELSKHTVFHEDHADKRLIFYSDRVPLAAHELAFIEKVNRDPNFPVLPKWWKMGDTLRYAHTVRLDLDKTKMLITEFLSTVQEIKDTKLSQETLGFVGSGNVYVYGKCRDECTNIYLSMNPKIRSVELNEYLGLVKFLILLVRNQTCVPGYLERVNLILNFKESESSKAFIVHFLDRLRYILIRVYPYMINRIIFYGDVSTFQEKFEEFATKMKGFCEISHFNDAGAMSAIGGVIPDIKVLSRLKDMAGVSSLTDIIAPNQLEVKYGGDRPNIEEYWPPTHHTAPGESIDDEDLGKLKIIPFYIYDEDVENFKQQHIPNDINVSKRPGMGGIQYKTKAGAGDFLSGPKTVSGTHTNADENRVRMIMKAGARTKTVSQEKTPTAKPGQDYLEADTPQGHLNKYMNNDWEVQSKAPSFHAGHLTKYRNPGQPKPVNGLFKLLGCCGDR